MKLPRALRLDRRRILSLLRYVVVAGLAVLATVVVGFAIQARLRLPPLQLWHRAPLTAEYRVDAADAPQRFEDYLQQEARLFAQLDQVIADAAITEPVSRFNPQSAPGQLARAERANRSYELLPAEPTGAVLLVHGLSDSPYSMHALADWYFARGFYVLSLRLPGHGTMPSGLLDVRWQDWYGAVMLAAKHAAARTHGGPLHLCGYSTGAALVALLATRSLADDTLPRPDRLVLLSAAIGVSPFAALANVASTLACVPYFETADWLDVLPEYDPYKYNSFPVSR